LLFEKKCPSTDFVSGLNPVGNCPQGLEKGKVRDIVAEKAGFTSSRQMRRARELVDARSVLVEAVDKGEQTLDGACSSSPSLPLRRGA